ncbi:MAG: hypothetical protein EG826_16570 [Deltaproteobacteria bacterium]|nr:hypothetical protein [Deltaproteobacteria bacterium]
MDRRRLEAVSSLSEIEIAFFGKTARARKAGGKTMEADPNRITYLDNARNILVYNVVALHVACMFTYPLQFFWAVIDKTGSSRFYETALIAMDSYLMPCLMFIAALFIFPSLQKGTAPEYIKKRFLRLVVPALVFLFCAGDIYFQLLLQRLNSVAPSYAETFLSFWRFCLNMPGVYLSGSEATLNMVVFNMQVVWFLMLLFFATLVVVLASLPFRRRNDIEPEKVEGRRNIIAKTLVFAAVLGFVYAAALLYYAFRDIQLLSWLIIGKVLQFQITKIWILLPLFLFGLYAYRKRWLTGDIGSWKIWGILAFTFLAVYVLLHHITLLPVVEEWAKVREHNLLFNDRLAKPLTGVTFELTALGTWFLLPAVCIFLLMFLLSFAKRFFNRSNAVTAFCSRHSINVYVLHYAFVLILQYTFLDLPGPSIVKGVLMILIVIPACLWLSHRLVYPYPRAAIASFVLLKLIALAAGFTFYYFALLAVIFISFAGAVIESTRYMTNRKTASATAG